MENVMSSETLELILRQFSEVFIEVTLRCPIMQTHSSREKGNRFTRLVRPSLLPFTSTSTVLDPFSPEALMTRQV